MNESAGGEQRTAGGSGRGLAWAAFVFMALLYGGLQLGSLGHPLFWQDEGETAMFGRRILEFGFPKVHGPEGVVYGMGVPLDVGTDLDRDAYRGSLWGQYYVAALGVSWAEGVDDLYEKTARVRFPFVMFGLLGLFTLLASFWKDLAARSGSALPAATVFMALLCASTSLQLHLREARYYGLVIGGVGLAVACVRSLSISRSGGRGWLRALALAAILVGLLNIFYPAALAVMGWIIVETWLGARRHQAWSLKQSVWLLLPVGFAMLVALYLVVAFDMTTVSRALASRWPFGPTLYLENLFHLMVFLLRWEFLGLLLVIQMILFGLGRRKDWVSPKHRPAWLLLRLAVWVAAVSAFNPIFFERYFVAMSPLISLSVVLEAEVLFKVISTRKASESAWRWGVLGAVLAVGVFSLAVRSGEILGRVGEVLHPVSGPVDYVVGMIRAEEGSPEQVVIATNYEAEPLMFYLGSQVFGRHESGGLENFGDLGRKRPDWVIPRTAQPRSLEAVRRALLGGGYQARRLPVADMPYNHLPELYSGRVLSETHWFETPAPGLGRPNLVVYRRMPAGPVNE
ncbi:MAG: hypothetical protein CBC48_00865 [bacterium TMED88]|nr:hypothetical protein [Deltaproteobacteria bacterium]OUV37288.1 MAG: hypothetical protein CBC48_00865 [bacterium TMED88]